MNNCDCTEKQWRAFSDTENFDRWQNVTPDSFRDPQTLRLETGCLSDIPEADSRHVVILETKRDG